MRSSRWNRDLALRLELGLTSFAAHVVGTMAAWWLAGLLMTVACVGPSVDPPAELRGVPVQRVYILHEAHDASIPYALFVPTSYDPAKPPPLVVLLHG